jgi:hypothetical protein
LRFAHSTKPEPEPDSDDANVSLTRSRFNLPNRSKVFLYGCPK